MNHINHIAKLITEDPDIFNKNAILAVHPNYVIDAASAAANKYGQNPNKYGKNRLKILTNYLTKFKTFINNELKNKSIIIITIMGEPYSLTNWYDPKTHWEKTDTIKQGMEQEQVFQAYQDLIDFISEIKNDPMVHILPEEEAGAACNLGQLDDILLNINELKIIGGNVTGCLKKTISELIKRMNIEIKIIDELTFDDTPSFWSKHS